MATFSMPNVYEQNWPLNQDKVVANIDSSAPMLGEQVSPPEPTSNPCQHAYMISDEGAVTQEISSFSIRHFVSSVRKVDIVKCWPFRQKILDKCLSIGVCPQLPSFIPAPKHPLRANDNNFMAADCFCPFNPSMIQCRSMESAQKRSSMNLKTVSSNSWGVAKEPETHRDDHMTSVGIHTPTPDSVISQEDRDERTQRGAEIQEVTIPSLNSRSSDTRENSRDFQDCLLKDLGISNVLNVLDHNMSETQPHTDHTPVQGIQDTTGGLKLLESVIETFQKVTSDRLEEASNPYCSPEAGLVEKKNNKAEDTFGVNFDVLMQVCPVCLNFVSTSNTALNAHIDHCLAAVLPGEMGNETKLSRCRPKSRKMRSMAEICANAPSRTLEELEFSTEKCTLSSEKFTENASSALNWKDRVVHRQPRTTMYRGPGGKCKDKSNKNRWQLSIDHDIESENIASTVQIVPLSTSMEANNKLQQMQDSQKSLELGCTEATRVLVKRKKSDPPSSFIEFGKDCVSLSSENLLSSEAFTDCSCSEMVGSPGIAPIDTSADEERRLQQEAHMAEQMSAHVLTHKKTAEHVHDQCLWTTAACSLVDASQIPALTSGGHCCSRIPTSNSVGPDDGEHFVEHQVHWLEKSKSVVPKSIGHENRPHLREGYYNDISASPASHTIQKGSLVKGAPTGQTGCHLKPGGNMGSLSENGCFGSNHASLDVQRESISQCAINAINVRHRETHSRLISTETLQTHKRLEILAYSLDTVSPERERSASTASDGDTSDNMREVREPTTSMESENKGAQEDDGTQCPANIYSRRKRQNLSYPPSHIHECTFDEFDTYDMSNRLACLTSAAERSPVGISHVSREAGATDKDFPSNEKAVGSTLCSSGFDELSEAIARTKITCDSGQLGTTLATSKIGTCGSNAMVSQNGYRYHQEAFKTFCGPNPFATLQQSRQANTFGGTQRRTHADSGVVEASIWGMGHQISHENVGRSSASYCKSFASSVNFGSKFDTSGCSCAVAAASRCGSSHILMGKSRVNCDQLSQNIPMLDYVRHPAGLLPLEDSAVYDEGFGIAFSSQFVSKNSTASDLFPSTFQGTARINRRLESKLDSGISGYRSIDYAEEQGVVHIFGNHVFKLMGKSVMVSNKEPGFANVGSKEAEHGFDAHCLECGRLERSEETHRLYAPTPSSRSTLTGEDMDLPLFGAWHRDSYDPKNFPGKDYVDVGRQSSPLPLFQNVDPVQYNNCGFYTPHPNPFVASQGGLSSNTYSASPSHASMRLNGWHGNMASLDAFVSKRCTLASPLQRRACLTAQQSGCLGAQADSFFSSVEDAHRLELHFQQARLPKIVAEAHMPAGISRSMPSGTLSDIIQNADHRLSLHCSTQSMQFRPG